MNKIITVLVTLFLFNAIQLIAGDRMVVVERFTSSTCPPCASNNPIMDAFLSSIDVDKIVGISYHMNWPAPGNDPMYLHNPADNNTRRALYSINSIPEARMDGSTAVLPPYNSSTLNTMFNNRTNLLSPVTVIVTETDLGDSVRVRATIYCEVVLVNPSVTLQFAIVEKHIHYTSPPGTNGETDFYDVMRKMLPTAAGNSLVLHPGQTYIVERTYYKDPVWQQAQIRSVVFVQSNPEILAAATKTNNFTLIPTTGYKSVLQGQSQSATYQMSIPVVANGYNSPVTLSAQVDPPNAGITVSFPGGNVISTFPATFNVQVNSSASVPSGEYRIIVTGTNTNNKVHKTSVAYLVGKNYISVGANRPNLRYAVDGQEFTGIRFYTWDLNSQHQLAAVSPQVFASTRYLYNNWSDGGDSSHAATINTNTNSYTCNYKIQFKIIPQINPGGIPSTVVGGNLFYDSASTVTISVNPAQVQYNGQTWYFNRWVGQGNGSYTGNNPTPQVTVHQVLVQQAVFDTIAPFGIQNLQTGIPKDYALHQNYPNPFNPVTKIKFDIPKSGDVKMVIYDILGSEVATLVNQRLEAGYYVTDFDASELASGVYLYKLEAESYSDVRRMVILK
jgi:hypothetical protein